MRPLHNWLRFNTGWLFCDCDVKEWLVIIAQCHLSSQDGVRREVVGGSGLSGSSLFAHCRVAARSIDWGSSNNYINLILAFVLYAFCSTFCDVSRKLLGSPYVFWVLRMCCNCWPSCLVDFHTLCCRRVHTGAAWWFLVGFARLWHFVPVPFRFPAASRFGKFCPASSRQWPYIVHSLLKVWLLLDSSFMTCSRKILTQSHEIHVHVCLV